MVSRKFQLRHCYIINLIPCVLFLGAGVDNLFRPVHFHVWRDSHYGIHNVRRCLAIPNHSEFTKGVAGFDFRNMGDTDQPFCQIRPHTDAAGSGVGGVSAPPMDQLQKGGRNGGYNSENLSGCKHSSGGPGSPIFRFAHGFHWLVSQCGCVRSCTLHLLYENVQGAVVKSRDLFHFTHHLPRLLGWGCRHILLRETNS